MIEIRSLFCLKRNLSLNFLFCQIPSISPEELVFLRLSLLRTVLTSLPHSHFLSSFLCRIKQRANSFAAPVNINLQDLTHLLFTVLMLNRFSCSFFGSSLLFLWPLVRPWEYRDLNAEPMEFLGTPPHERSRVAPSLLVICSNATTFLCLLYQTFLFKLNRFDISMFI